MYYPYFRGKQFDLLALTTLAENHCLSPKVTPIIEPVKNSKTLKKMITVFQENEQPFYLIQNPQTGDFLTSAGLLQLKSLPVNQAVIIEQPIETLKERPDLLIIGKNAVPALQSDWQNNQVKVLIPEEFRLLQKVKGVKILSQDPFTRLPKNSFYQELTDELFSTAHLIYQKKGFVGFSDFSIDSRIYYEHSYPEKMLTLHLVYFDNNHQLRIHHFHSSEEAASQKEKFFELMENVSAWEQKLCGNQVTLGFDLLIKAAINDKFPGMGVMRKAAVMHHLELIARYLK